jgi:hypothetical protein
MYELPQPIKDWIREQFASCNTQIAYDLSKFPGIREESLDNNFISYFSKIPGPLKFESNWIVTIDAYFIGGGHHYGRWEVADIGLIIIFRRNGILLKSKLAFLQSKKLYAASIRPILRDHQKRMGLGRLLVTGLEYEEIVASKLVKFEERSKYKAFKKDSEQQMAMSSFSEKFTVPMYYLFYNTLSLPHSVESPLQNAPPQTDNLIGCRVVKKESLDKAIKEKSSNYIPSYGDVKLLLQDDYRQEQHTAGWRLEYFVTDLLLDCKEGLIDNSPNFETLLFIMSRKTSPIAASLSITIDLRD